MAEETKKMTEEETTDFYIVGAFSYRDKAHADKAVKEQARIEKLIAQVDYSKPKVVYALYSKILEGGVLETPEGISYLVKLNEYLTSQQMAIGKEIPPIPEELLIRKETIEVPVETKAKKSKKKPNIVDRIRDNKEDPTIYKIIIGFLLVAVIAMLVLTGLSGSPTILNYKKTIQNQYSNWATNLEQKESELKQKEQELQDLEDKLKANNEIPVFEIIEE